MTVRANHLLGMIRRSFKFPKTKILRLLYCSLVRPHLEYAISSWRPYLEKDIDKIEKVQRRTTRLVHELANLEYPHRLSRLKLPCLKTRIVGGDLIQMFKLVNNMEIVNFSKDLNYSLNNRPDSKRYNLRRNSKNLVRERVRNCSQRFNYFKQSC